MKRQKVRHTRGTAAVEFAICVPVLLMLLAGTLYFGLALVARVELDNLASSAVRTCVLQQLGTSSQAVYEQCAMRQFAALIENQPHLCDRGQPSPTVSTSDRLDASIAANFISAQVYLLKLDVACDKRIAPIVNGANNYKGGTIPGYITIHAGAGMPFVQATRAR